jgi:type IV secretion system protein VirD4
VAPVAELDALASTAAGHGIQLVTVWQDLGQLHARYGVRANSVVNNHRVKVFLSGLADPATLEHASQLVGDAMVSTRTRSTDARGMTTTTESPLMRRLLPPDALRMLPPGTAVAVSGHLPPLRLSLRPWHDDRFLRARAATAHAAPRDDQRRAWLTGGRASAATRTRRRAGRQAGQ